MQPCWAEENSFKTLEYITDPNLNTMCECYNKCINRAVVIIIIIIIIVLLFYFILQNNSKITILTFMNVDEFSAFILAETSRKSSVLLFVDNSRYINDVCRTYRIVTCPKLHTNVTEQLTSNTVSAQIFFALWNLNPG